MEQVGVQVDISVAQIKATLYAATLDMIRKGIVQSEDIYWQRVTYEKPEILDDGTKCAITIN